MIQRDLWNLKPMGSPRPSPPEPLPTCALSAKDDLIGSSGQSNLVLREGRCLPEWSPASTSAMVFCLTELPFRTCTWLFQVSHGLSPVDGSTSRSQEPLWVHQPGSCSLGSQDNTGEQSERVPGTGILKCLPQPSGETHKRHGLWRGLKKFCGWDAYLRGLPILLVTTFTRYLVAEDMRGAGEVKQRVSQVLPEWLAG